MIIRQKEVDFHIETFENMIKKTWIYSSQNDQLKTLLKTHFV